MQFLDCNGCLVQVFAGEKVVQAMLHQVGLLLALLLLAITVNSLFECVHGALPVGALLVGD